MPQVSPTRVSAGHCVEAHNPHPSCHPAGRLVGPGLCGIAEDLDLVMPVAKSILGPCSYVNYYIPCC